MNKKTREKVGWDRFKEYDEQREIRKKYFKGCNYCKGEIAPLDWKSNKSLWIKGNTIVIKDFGKEKANLIYPINFCPFCGKKLIKKLKLYID